MPLAQSLITAVFVASLLLPHLQQTRLAKNGLLCIIKQPKSPTQIKTAILRSRSSGKRFDQTFNHICRSVSKNRRRVHGTSPFWMSQNFAKSSIISFVVQQALHAIHFRINFVAIQRHHGQSGAWINIVGPKSFGSQLFANVLAKGHEHIEQSIFLLLDVIAHCNQILPRPLVCGYSQQSQCRVITSIRHRCIPRVVSKFQILVVKNMPKFPHQWFW
mmetsp:Transcript_20986/g.36117  ORF Transcript_20986/g.36117 Transcript_20986/m.36117 type:complete len:217 (-) Transcript_20986:72-722(-)